MQHKFAKAVASCVRSMAESSAVVALVDMGVGNGGLGNRADLRELHLTRLARLEQSLTGLLQQPGASLDFSGEANSDTRRVK